MTEESPFTKIKHIDDNLCSNYALDDINKCLGKTSRKLAESYCKTALLRDELDTSLNTITKLSTQLNTAKMNYKISTNKRKYIAVLELLIVAEKHQGFVRGSYVRNTISNTLMRNFNYDEVNYLNLIFSKESDKKSFCCTEIARRLCMMTNEKASLHPLECVNYLYTDILGDVIITIRMFGSDNYGFESYSEHAKFIPSMNKIVCEGMSLSTFYNDCTDGIYRLSNIGYNHLLDEKTYPNMSEQLVNLSKKYIIVHKKNKLNFYDNTEEALKESGITKNDLIELKNYVLVVSRM